MENYSSSSTDEMLELLMIYLFLAEFAVGVIQLFGAIIRTAILIIKNKPVGQLKSYWIMVLIYFLVFGILYLLQQLSINIGYNSSSIIIIWISTAWLIAIWYCINIVFKKTQYCQKNTTLNY